MPSVKASSSPVDPMACGVAEAVTAPAASHVSPPSREICTTGVAARFEPAVVTRTRTAQLLSGVPVSAGIAVDVPVTLDIVPAAALPAPRWWYAPICPAVPVSARQKISGKPPTLPISARSEGAGP